jgi:hypothetical protein
LIRSEKTFRPRDLYKRIEKGQLMMKSKLLVLSLLAAACGVEQTSHFMTFEELKASAYEEEPGKYIIEGDMRFDDSSLREYYDTVLVPEMEQAELARQGIAQSESDLTVNRVQTIIPGRWDTYCPPAPPCGRVWVCDLAGCRWQTVCPPAPPCVPVWIPPMPGLRDDVWSSADAANLTFCISNSENGSSGTGTLTTTEKAKFVDAMNTAISAWNSASGARFVYNSSQDGNCNSNNTNVVFDVHANYNNPGYIARAFFPSDTRADRNIQVNYNDLTGSSPSDLVSTLLHELGHVLGFRHEHIRTNQFGADPACGEVPGNHRTLTVNDGNSIMHYDFCNGALANALTLLTSLDVAGAQSLYGSGTVPAGGIAGLASKCLDVQGGNSASGTPLQLWDCNGTNAQRFSIEPTGELKVLGKCVDLAGNNTASGTQIRIWDCNNTTAQKWIFWNNTLRHHASGKCVDVSGGNSASGTPIQLWDCNGTGAQRWIKP